MYEQAYGFSARPFTSTPFVKHYFAAESIEQSLGQARICIERASGPVVIVGGTGTGKSLMLAMLQDQYQTQFNVVNLGCARLEQREDLWQNIMFELKLPFQDMTESDLRFALLEYLKPSERCPNGVLLLIDEAHSLPIGLLDELRLVTNFVRDGLPRVRLVMAGSQRLEENLTDPTLVSLNQRIATRCFLENLHQEETGQYVTEHIKRVSANGESPFDAQSLRAIHELTEGCPRLINQVCDVALILAGVRGAGIITEDCIQEAWADVQSIPGNWQPKPDIQPAENGFEKPDDWTVVEFGQLDDSIQSNRLDEFVDDDANENELLVGINDVPLSQEDDPTEDSFDDQAIVDQAIDASEREFSPVLDEVESDSESDEMTPDELEHIQTLEFEQRELMAQAGVQDEDDVNNADHACDGDDAIDALDPIGESVPHQDLFPVVSDVTNDSRPDQDTESSINDDQSQTTAAVDPFQETFDEVEYLVDRYAPFVAHHNMTSLTVTDEDLELVVPSDPESSVPSFRHTWNESDHAVISSTADIGDEIHAGVVQENPDTNGQETVEPSHPTAKLEPMMDSSIVSDDFVASASETCEISGKDADDDSNVHQENTAESKAAYHSHSTPAPSREVEQQADEILRRLEIATNVSCETDNSESVPSQSEAALQQLAPDDAAEVDVPAAAARSQLSLMKDDSAESTIDSSHPHPSVSLLGPNSQATEIGDPNTEFETQNAVIEETQQILNEILQQKSIIAEQQGRDFQQSQGQDSHVSEMIEFPVIDALADQKKSVSDDDREMIIVSRMDEQIVDECDDADRKESAPIPFPSTPISTGRAERMDYQQLFDQLRNISDGQTDSE